MRRVGLLLVLSLFAFNAIAQGVISGVLLDDKSGTAIQFSSLVLYSKKDSVVSGGFTDDKGRFEFKKVPFGSYYIKSQSVTHKPYKSKEIVLSKKTPKVNLGIVKLLSLNLELEEVEIKKEKAVVKIQPAKKTFDAASTGVSSGGTGTDVLNNLPSVTVDQDGNISLRGNTNLRILIDGKPVGTSAEDAALILSQLPANSIESVEIITVPSAKYDPEGVGGIINIVLKKQTQKGVHGGLNAAYGVYDQAGKWDKVNASGNVSYRAKKWGVNASYAFKGGTYITDVSDFGFTNYGDSTLNLNTIGDNSRLRPSHNTTIGSDFQLSKTTKLGVSGGANFTSKNADNLSNIYWDYSTGYRDTVNRRSINKGIRSAYNGQVSLDQKVKKGKLRFLSQYIFNESPETGDFEEVDLIQREERFNSHQEAIGQLDYELPFLLDTSKGAPKYKFEAGAKYTYRGIQEDYDFFEFNNDVYLKNLDISNSLTYQEQVFAGYAMLTREVKGLTLQGGIRAEDTRLTSRVSDFNFDKKLFNWFPSFYIGKKLNQFNTLSLSYSKRIKRPTGRQLNPIPSYSNPYRLREGNANLLPERAHLAEISYLKISKKLTLSSTLWYQYRDDRMGRIGVTDSLGVTTIKWINFHYHQTAGFELFTNWRITPWLTNINTATLYRTWVDGSNYQDGFKAIYTGSDIKNIINIKASKKLKFTVIGNYYSQRIAVVGTVLPRYHVDVSATYKFLGDRAKFSVRFADVFKTQFFRINTDVNDWTREVKYDWESQVLWVSLSYKFGKRKFGKKKPGFIRPSNRGGDAM